MLRQISRRSLKDFVHFLIPVRVFGQALFNNKIYWTEGVNRADFDGSNVETVLEDNIGFGRQSAIEVDGQNGKIYWSNFDKKKIQRCNLDGSDIEDLVDLTDVADGLALDAINEKIYWGTRDQKIERSNLDGTNVESVIPSPGVGWVTGIDVDVNSAKMYWTQRASSSIRRADLDGTNKEIIVAFSNSENPRDIALDIAMGKVYWSFNPNIAGDEKIQRSNLDGTNIEDIIVQQDLFIEGIALLTDAPTAVDNAPLFLDNFELLQNYPNPFIPRTTIQYKLPRASNAKLVVYSLLGKKVATLVNDKQEAGVYSVQWDGKNDSGNNVASGVYLYRLEVGDPSTGQKFIQVRKLILVR